jgi:hypothetical protein
LREYNFYAEDNWKITPQNLTLNLGYRYEYVAAPREVESRIQYGYGATKTTTSRASVLRTVRDFKEGILGKLFGETGQSSIRGGYGIYHGRLFQSVFSQSGATCDLIRRIPRFSELSPTARIWQTRPMVLFSRPDRQRRDTPKP